MINTAIGAQISDEHLTINEKSWGISSEDIGSLVSIVREKDREIKEVLKDGETLLHIAARDDAEETCLALIRSGYNINAIDNFGQTPLFLAIQKGNIEIIEMLLDSGADVNCFDMYLNTPLICAITAELDIKYDLNIKIIDILIKSGANLMWVNAAQETICKVAEKSGRTKILNHLIEKLGDVNE